AGGVAGAAPVRGLARREVAAEGAAGEEGRRARGHALVVPAEGAEAARAQRVGGEVDARRAVGEAAELIGREERGAGERDLLAERAVELRRVAARFVDLQRELRRVEDEGARAARAGRGLKELERLLADARRVAGEGGRGDEPVAGALDAALGVPRPAARPRPGRGRRRRA